MSHNFLAIFIALIYLSACDTHTEHEATGDDIHQHTQEHDHEVGDHDHEHGDQKGVHEEQHNHESDAHQDDQDHDHENTAHDEESHQVRMNHDEPSTQNHEEGGHDHTQEIHQYQVQKILPRPFYEILHVSGRIMPSQKGQSMLAARHSGLVVFDNYRLIEGQKVSKGQKLFLISAKGLTHNNLETKYNEVKNEYEKALQDYERARNLLKNQIISQSEYQERKVDYQNIKSRYEIIKKNYVKGGQPVYASSDGFISQLYVKEGEYVDIGSPLAAIVEDKRLVVKAEVPQDLISELSYVTAASFSPAYSEKTFFTDSLNGQLLSVGRSTGASVYTPVFFEIDYQPELLPGAFADIYLHAHDVNDAVVIPQTAVLEELNRYYVYLWTGHEFKKQYIEISGTNGKMVSVASGLSPEDQVATKDVYRIRLSQMSGAMPEHAHNHAH